MYAIVDIETTGGYAAAHGIIEISIHVFDGTTVVKKLGSRRRAEAIRSWPAREGIAG